MSIANKFPVVYIYKLNYRLLKIRKDLQICCKF